MRVHNSLIIQQPNTASIEATAKETAQNPKASFQNVLENQISNRQALQFSKHAFTRLSARDIQLSVNQLERVENGVAEARQKGIRDSLVLVDDVALVVNVKNKVVITAMNGIKTGNENIFTNIDGAVIV